MNELDNELGFDVPIVLFIFKRVDKTQKIIKQISKIKPKKLYIIADGARNDREVELVNNCRDIIDASIDWNCEVIKNYSVNNRGVYKNIGLGAKWVFEREEKAIFLEDDNLPDESFFKYCYELLNKYEENEKVMWICGTNYLEEYNNQEQSSYVFTQHLLPCGWASWAKKFLKYYDGELKHFNEQNIRNIKKTYSNKKLYKQQINLMLREKKRIEKGLDPISWDYQMEFSVRNNNLLAIAPTKNLIENIGVDEHSIHGGVSYDNVMTERFCRMKKISLSFPLKDPSEIKVDLVYEKKISNIILYPLKDRMKQLISSYIRKIIKFDEDKPLFHNLRRK